MHVDEKSDIHSSSKAGAKRESALNDQSIDESSPTSKPSALRRLRSPFIQTS